MKLTFEQIRDATFGAEQVYLENGRVRFERFTGDELAYYGTQGWKKPYCRRTGSFSATASCTRTFRALIIISEILPKRFWRK